MKRFLLVLTLVSAAFISAAAQSVPSPAELHRRAAALRALPEDNLKAIHSLLALPPVTQANAQFLGNATAIAASPGNAFAMVRETDCSLTAFNAAYTLSTQNTAYNYQSRSFHYEQNIHAAAALTTPGDQFTHGCADPGVGVQSNNLIYLGLTSSNLRVGALAGYNGRTAPQRNQLFTIVSKEDGTLVGITTQPDPTGIAAGTTPVNVAGGDLNKDGTNDLVAVNTGVSTSGGVTTGTVTVSIFLGHPDGSFTVGPVYAIPGASSRSLVIDDFNGDGIPDIVIPTGSFNTTPVVTQITFLPGKGDGTFGAPKTQTVNATGVVLSFSDAAEGLVSGDFNGDGKKDLITGHGVVLLGNGDGTFAEQSSLAFSSLQTNSSAPPGLAVGDFNKDGKLDIAAGSGDQIYTFLGNGNGAFTPGHAYASIDNHGYLTATDLDGDGNLDLFSGDATNGIFGGDDFTSNVGYALMGNGDGSFRGAPQTSAIQAGALVDLNADGKLDYIGIANGADIVSTVLRPYLGNGDGSFREGAPISLAFTYKGAAYALVRAQSYGLADFNGDGKLDLFIQASPGDYTSAGSPTVFPGLLVLLGNGDGTFGAPTYMPFPSLVPPGTQDYLYTVAGLTTAARADGKSELVYKFLTQDFNNSILYYLGYATQLIKGDGTLGAPVTTDISVTAAQPSLIFNAQSNIVDLNGDKTPDLIEFVPKVVGPGGVLVSPSSYLVYLGKPDGTFAAGKPTNLVDNPDGFFPVSVADVNNDGKLDLIASGLNAAGLGEVGVALGNGDGTYAAPKKILLTTTPGSIAVGDFDGDGKADLALTGFLPPNDSGVFPGNGDGTFQSVPSGNNDGTVVALQPIALFAYGPHTVADLNGDGKLDIAGPTVLINRYGLATPLKTASATGLTVAPTAITVGATVTLTATVTAASGTVIPTGTVNFLNGAASLGTATLNAAGVATLAVSTLPVGTEILTVSYPGDTNFNPSVSNTVNLVVSAAPVKVNTSTTLTAASATITLGQNAVLTATVVPASGTAAPTGTVTFLNGANSIGTAPLNAQGVAALTIGTLALGAQSLTASYPGDTNFNASVSAVTTVTVNPVPVADFTLALSPATATLASGAQAASTVTVSPVNAFTQAVTLSCSGLPANTFCAFSAATITPAGAPATATLTLKTGTTHALTRPPSPLSPSRNPLPALAFAALAAIALIRRRPPFRALCFLCVTALSAALVTGCGSNAASSTPTPTPTPSGTYTVTVTGTSTAATHSANFTLTVQ